MTRETALFGAFVLVAIAQLSVPGRMIWQREGILSQGAAYKFQTAPVDPYDAFRGRYVALSFESDSAPWAGEEAPKTGQTLYATIEEGPDGFASFALAGTIPPSTGDYLRVRAGGSLRKDNTVALDVPFDRFYMEESLAPEADRLAQIRSGRDRGDAYALVRVRNGKGVIQDIFIDGIPIAEKAREALKKTPPNR